jgi:hypothetical protein
VGRGSDVTLDRELTLYEAEVAAAVTARRDAAFRLKVALSHDVAGYEDGMEMVRNGRAMEILAPAATGVMRQGMSDAVSEFEGGGTGSAFPWWPWRPTTG